MTIKLVQKRFLKGVREFEIVDETIFVCNKSLFREEKLTIDLSILDPEPVVVGSELAFYNPHKGHPVFKLLLDKPNKGEFDRFVEILTQTISGDDGSVESVAADTAQQALSRNIYEEPPEYDESEASREQFGAESVNVARLEDDINMLRTYLKDERYHPLLETLESLKAEPQNEAMFCNVLDALNELGIYQGSVLTYAPYLIVLVSKYSR